MRLFIFVNGRRVSLLHGGTSWIAMLDGQVVGSHPVSVLALVPVLEAIEQRHAVSVPQMRDSAKA
jgi:hypothetical protein